MSRFVDDVAAVEKGKFDKGDAFFAFADDADDVDDPIVDNEPVVETKQGQDAVASVLAAERHASDAAALSALSTLGVNTKAAIEEAKRKSDAKSQAQELRKSKKVVLSDDEEEEEEEEDDDFVPEEEDEEEEGEEEEEEEEEEEDVEVDEEEDEELGDTSSSEEEEDELTPRKKKASVPKKKKNKPTEDEDEAVTMKPTAEEQEKVEKHQTIREKMSQEYKSAMDAVSTTAEEKVEASAPKPVDSIAAALEKALNPPIAAGPPKTVILKLSTAALTQTKNLIQGSEKLPKLVIKSSSQKVPVISFSKVIVEVVDKKAIVAARMEDGKVANLSNDPVRTMRFIHVDRPPSGVRGADWRKAADERMVFVEVQRNTTSLPASVLLSGCKGKDALAHAINDGCYTMLFNTESTNLIPTAQDSKQMTWVSLISIYDGPEKTTSSFYVTTSAAGARYLRLRALGQSPNVVPKAFKTHGIVKLDVSTLKPEINFVSDSKVIPFRMKPIVDPHSLVPRKTAEKKKKQDDEEGGSSDEDEEAHSMSKKKKEKHDKSSKHEHDSESDHEKNRPKKKKKKKKKKKHTEEHSESDSDSDDDSKRKKKKEKKRKREESDPKMQSDQKDTTQEHKNKKSAKVTFSDKETPSIFLSVSNSNATTTSKEKSLTTTKDNGEHMLPTLNMGSNSSSAFLEVWRNSMSSYPLKEELRARVKSVLILRDKMMNNTTLPGCQAVLGEAINGKALVLLVLSLDPAVHASMQEFVMSTNSAPKADLFSM